MSILAQFLLGLGLFLFGFGSGVKWHAGQDAIAENARQVNQRSIERMRRQNANTAAAAHESDKVEIRTEFVPIREEVERVVEKTVYRDMCFDDDGLRVIQSAISRVNGTTGQLVDPVSASPATP